MYRGITLTSCVYKIFCGVLNNRLQSWCEVYNKISDEQNGFRPGRNTVDQLFSVSTIVETRKIRRLSTCVSFIVSFIRKAYDRIPRGLLLQKLQAIGIKGAMFRVFEAIYKETKCYVQINGKHTSWFPSECGLKQGCLLSTTLFNLYINDLVDSVKSLEVMKRIVPILLYADDIVLLAEKEKDLQSLLHVLNDWCSLNGLSVNNEIRFRPPSVARSSFKFTCGQSVINTVSSYKYLGLTLNEYVDYSESITPVVQSASRAFGSIISKFRSKRGLPFAVYTKLYDTLVWLILNYSASIWGIRDYNAVNQLHNQACPFYLGVARYTPTAAVHGETGWSVPHHKQLVSVIKLFHHFLKMDDSRVNRHIFNWALDTAKNRCHNWCWHVRKNLSEFNLLWMVQSNSYWDSLVPAVNDAVIQKVESDWLAQLNLETAINGTGQIKLRTYKEFKQTFTTEPYILNALSKVQHGSLMKFRSGVARIQLELGRYTGQPVEER